MSFQAAISKLNPHVKELVVSVTENGSRHVGESEKDRAEVNEWIEKAGHPDVSGEANIQVNGVHMRHRAVPKDDSRTSMPSFCPETTLSAII